MGPGGIASNSSDPNCTGGAASVIDQWLLGNGHLYDDATAKVRVLLEIASEKSHSYLFTFFNFIYLLLIVLPGLCTQLFDIVHFHFTWFLQDINKI